METLTLIAVICAAINSIVALLIDKNKDAAFAWLCAFCLLLGDLWK